MLSLLFLKVAICLFVLALVLNWLSPYPYGEKAQYLADKVFTFGFLPSAFAAFCCAVFWV